MMKLEIGQTAPDFRVETTQGLLTLSDLVAQCEKGVVVYFYPRASTPGCTKEACDFRDSLTSLLAGGYQVIGISPDKMPALEKFRDRQGLTFPLGSDPDKKILTAWGAWGEKNLYGKVSTGVIRSTFVVGKDGRIVVAQYRVKATGHVARLRRDLGLE